MKKVGILLLLCLLLTGCSDQMSHSLMIISMGVDISDQGYTLSVKAPNYGATGGGGDQGGESKTEENYLNLSVTGKTWEHAMTLLNAATPRTMRFGQLREVILSLDAAQSGQLSDILTQVDILQNVRTHAHVIVCAGEAKEFLKNQKSAIGKRLSMYLDVTLESLREKGYIPTALLPHLLRDVNSAWRDPLIAYAAFAEAGQTGADESAVDRPVDQLSGPLSAEGSSMGEYVGALAVGGEGKFALLTGYEVQLYHLITGEIGSMAFGVDGQYFDVLPRGKCTMRLKKENGQDALYLNLPVTVEYSAFREAPTEDIAAHLENEIVRLMEKLQLAACDALGYGGLAAREHKTLFEFSQSGWKERYQAAQLRVEVTVTLRQQGRT